MDNKYGEFIGVDSLYYAEVTANSTSAYTPGTPQILAPVAEIAAAPEISNVTTYYDNAAANNYVSEGKTEVKVVVPNLDSQTLAKILGKLYDQTSGKVYDNGEANPPEIALGFRYNMGKNGYRYYWYLCGTCSGGEEAATTQKESIDVKTYELTFTAYTTAKQFTVGGKTIPLKRIFADTADTNFKDADTWFTAIPVPATV